MHLGHRAVLADLAGQARRAGNLETVVVTFDVHPRSVVSPAEAPKMLTTVEHRIEILRSLGVDHVGVLPFALVRGFSPDEFVRRVVVDAFAARVVTVGRGFRYGARRSGDVARLAEAGRLQGFQVGERELLEGEHGPISSSAIRRCVIGGDVGAAARLLGRSHELRGPAREKDGPAPGREWPRAAFMVDRTMAVPAPGAYAVMTVVGGEELPGLCLIGAGSERAATGSKVEVYRLDGISDALRGEVRARFVERLGGPLPQEHAGLPPGPTAEHAARALRALGWRPDAGPIRASDRARTAAIRKGIDFPPPIAHHRGRTSADRRRSDRGV